MIAMQYSINVPADCDTRYQVLDLAKPGMERLARGQPLRPPAITRSSTPRRR
jgi:hypothetical protein